MYDNISQYYRAYHNNVTNAWYETTMNMLINKQEYAVEAVKLEWLLRKRKMPNLNNLKKSKEEKQNTKTFRTKIIRTRRREPQIGRESVHPTQREISWRSEGVAGSALGAGGK